MKSPSTRLPAALLAVSCLCACARYEVPTMPSLSVPDFSDWFVQENVVVVTEVANSVSCNSPTEKTSLTVLDGSRAVAVWQQGRNIELVDLSTLKNAHYVAIDLGQRNSAGHGLAVSRQAGLKNGTLVLKATLFAPEAGAVNPEAPTSPCSLVRLPDVPFSDLRLIDQKGKLKASAPGQGS